MSEYRGRALVCAVALVGVVAGLAGPAAAQDQARGAELYALCANCHGETGAGSRERNAPLVAALPAWYVETQLRNFKTGLRGYHAADVTGLQMRPMAAALVSDDDLRAVAAFVAALPPVAPEDAGGGDAARGQAAYATCLACHGPDGLGNEALKAPPIAGQSDWYLAAQLAKFKAGERGAAPGDVMGMQMRGMAATLADAQAVQDVTAYVRTLRK